MKVEIRPVHSDELDVLRDLALETFITAFGEDNRPEDMQTYLEQSLSREAVKRQFDNPNSAFYFALLDDNPVGYIKYNIGEAQNEQELENAMEIERIYVHQSLQGKQIGNQLFQFVVARALELDLDWIWLGVWERNEGAIRFYLRNGFEKFGEHTFKLGSDIQTDIMMRCKLKALT